MIVKLRALLFAMLIVLTQTVLAGEKLTSITTERGNFSLGLDVGAGTSGLQNTNGDFSGYQMTHYGADLDFAVLGSDAGKLSIFVSYLMGTGKNSSNQQNKMETAETVGGLRFNLNSNLYVSAGLGNNIIKLDSNATTAKLDLSHTVNRFALGFEFSMSESLYLGFEVAYRNGVVKKSENPSLTNSTSFEATMGLVKLIWSPPSVINNYSSKSKYNLR